MRILFILGLLSIAAPALAEEIERVPPVANAAATKECGTCHMAYQPQLLSAASWQILLADLANHFDNDASLGDAARKEIEAYYVANAGRSGDTPGEPRITLTSWWINAHEEVPAASWTKPDVKFKGNCVACHQQADKGVYEGD